MSRDLERTVIQQKVEALNQQLKRGPEPDADAEQKILWLKSQIKMVAEILRSLGK